MSDEKMQKKDPLFDNPVFVNMKKSLPIEEQEKYDKMGEYMYNTVNVDINEQGEMNAAVEQVAQIKVLLQSGMHPSYLTRDEREFLENYLGKEWYLEFGYLQADLNRINF